MSDLASILEKALERQESKLLEPNFRTRIRLYKNKSEHPSEDSGEILDCLLERVGMSPERLYTELEYEQNQVLDPGFFFGELSRFLRNGAIRAEVETVAWPPKRVLKKREFNNQNS